MHHTTKHFTNHLKKMEGVTVAGTLDRHLDFGDDNATCAAETKRLTFDVRQLLNDVFSRDEGYDIRVKQEDNGDINLRVCRGVFQGNIAIAQGYDMVVVDGKSQRSLVLHLNADSHNVELENAHALSDNLESWMKFLGFAILGTALAVITVVIGMLTIGRPLGILALCAFMVGGGVGGLFGDSIGHAIVSRKKGKSANDGQLQDSMFTWEHFIAQLTTKV